MQKYQNVSQDTIGNIIQAATISVWTDSSHTVAATIYSDNGVTLLPSNTVTTDTLGNFYFYAANGRYYLKQTKSGSTTVFLDDVLLFDPADASPSGSASVTFIASGTGAAIETTQDAIRNWGVNVLSFIGNDLSTSARSTLLTNIAAGTDNTDLTTYIQNALNTGKHVYFPKGTYHCATALVMATGQMIVGDGIGLTTLVQSNGLHGLLTTGASRLVCDMTLQGDYDNSTSVVEGATATQVGSWVDMNGTTKVNFLVTITGTATVKLQTSNDQSSVTDVSTVTASTDGYSTTISQRYARWNITSRSSGTINAAVTKLQPTTDTVSNALVNGGGTLRNVKLYKSPSHGVNAAGATDSVLINVIIDTIGFEGFQQSSGSNPILSNVTISNCLKAGVDCNVSGVSLRGVKTSTTGKHGSVDATAGVWIEATSGSGSISNISLTDVDVSDTGAQGVVLKADGGSTLSEWRMENVRAKTCSTFGVTLDATPGGSVGIIKNGVATGIFAANCGNAGFSTQGNVTNFTASGEVDTCNTLAPASQASVWISQKFGNIDASIDFTVTNAASGTSAIRTEGSNINVRGALSSIDGTGTGFEQAWSSAANVNANIVARNFTSAYTDANTSGCGTIISSNRAMFLAGAVGSPSIFLGPDTTTGWYRIGANEVGFAVSATKVLDISSTGFAVTGVVTATGAGEFGGFTNGSGVNLGTKGADGTTSYITQQLSGGTSGYGSFTQYTDSATYNTGFGTETNGDLAAYTGRFPGTAGTKFMSLTAAGLLSTKGPMRPAQDTGAIQTACGLYAGTGAPNNSNGQNGDIYFRGDGGASTTVYQRRAGSWVGIV